MQILAVKCLYNEFKKNIGLNSVTRKINDELPEVCEIYTLTIFQKMRLLEAFYVMIVSISHNFVNNTNSTIFKTTSLNLNWQERLHDEQQVNVGTLPVQSNDCHSSEQILLTTYDIDMLMNIRKTYKKSHNRAPEHKFLKNLNFESERNIT